MRIAAFQRHAIFDNLDHVCDVLERDLRWAVSKGIQMALFPETFLLGHSYDPQVIAARVERLTNGGLEMLCSLGQTRQSSSEHLNDEVISLPTARL
jgi:predicted amidohydrolase